MVLYSVMCSAENCAYFLPKLLAEICRVQMLLGWLPNAHILGDILRDQDVVVTGSICNEVRNGLFTSQLIGLSPPYINSRNRVHCCGVRGLDLKSLTLGRA